MPTASAPAGNVIIRSRTSGIREITRRMIERVDKFVAFVGVIIGDQNESCPSVDHSNTHQISFLHGAGVDANDTEDTDYE